MIFRVAQILAIGFFLTNPALAASEPQRGDPGTIDMTVVLKDQRGKPAKDGDAVDEDGKTCQGDACPILTLGHAIEHVLYANFKEDANLDPKQKAARARLAEQIRDNPAARLTVAQNALIQTLLGRVYGGLVLSQTYALLDPNAELPEVK